MPQQVPCFDTRPNTPQNCPPSMNEHFLVVTEYFIFSQMCVVVSVFFSNNSHRWLDRVFCGFFWAIRALRQNQKKPEIVRRPHGKKVSRIKSFVASLLLYLLNLLMGSLFLSISYSPSSSAPLLISSPLSICFFRALCVTTIFVLPSPEIAHWERVLRFQLHILQHKRTYQTTVCALMRVVFLHLPSRPYPPLSIYISPN